MPIMGKDCAYEAHYLYHFLGFGPKGGRSLVEHRGNLYVRTYVRPSVRTYVRPPPEAHQRLAQASQRLAQASQRLA